MVCDHLYVDDDANLNCAISLICDDMPEVPEPSKCNENCPHFKGYVNHETSKEAQGFYNQMREYFAAKYSLEDTIEEMTKIELRTIFKIEEEAAQLEGRGHYLSNEEKRKAEKVKRLENDEEYRKLRTKIKNLRRDRDGHECRATMLMMCHTEKYGPLPMPGRVA